MSRHIIGMNTAIQQHPKDKKALVNSQGYDVTTDAKNRISLRGAKTKHFHVKALPNGGFLLEPRISAPPKTVSAKTLHMLDQSVAALKEGKASAPIDLSSFVEE